MTIAVAVFIEQDLHALATSQARHKELVQLIVTFRCFGTKHDEHSNSCLKFVCKVIKGAQSQYGPNKNDQEAELSVQIKFSFVRSRMLKLYA